MLIASELPRALPGENLGRATGDSTVRRLPLALHVSSPGFKA
jgi:hypothetical protein